MPVSSRLLRGPSLQGSVTSFITLDSHEYTYTRKKRPNGESPGERDTLAWRWNSSGHPEEVFRSPIDTHEWITRPQRILLIATLLHVDAPFTTRKGFTPVHNPQKGTRAWFRVTGSVPRRQFEFNGSVWVSVKRADML